MGVPFVALRNDPRVVRLWFSSKELPERRPNARRRITLAHTLVAGFPYPRTLV
jgi:hypothetical protein